MRLYLFYVHDRRYAVPTFLSRNALSDEAAIEQARAMLADAPDYDAIEIVEDNRTIAKIARD